MTSDRPILHEIPRLRLGNVAYLNSAPLTYGWEEAFAFEHPAVLAEKLRLGELDGGLAPLYALLDAERYVLVDGVGICAEGPVYSVGVVAAGPLEELTEVALTEASRSSRNLLKLLYAEFIPKAQPAFPDAALPEHTEVAWPEAIDREFTACRQGKRGLLLIGDRALAAHRLLESADGGAGDLRFHDLAEVWGRFTGLPFVFAMWGLRVDLPSERLLTTSRELRELAVYGLAHREEIAAQAGPDALRYLTENIRYAVESPQRAGIAEYLRLLKKHELLPKTASLPRFI